MGGDYVIIFLGWQKKKGLAAFHIHAERMNKLMFRGMKIEISHRDILLTSFSDRPYLHTFSPVNMMMNNISWSAAECVSHGESPGRFWLLLVFSSFLYTTISLRGRVKWRGGQVREGKAREIITTHILQKHTTLWTSSSPWSPLSPLKIFSYQ